MSLTMSNKISILYIYIYICSTCICIVSWAGQHLGDQWSTSTDPMAWTSVKAVVAAMAGYWTSHWQLVLAVVRVSRRSGFINERLTRLRGWSVWTESDIWRSGFTSGHTGTEFGARYTNFACVYIYIVQILAIRIGNVETFAILYIISRLLQYNIKYKQIIYRYAPHCTLI